VKYGKQISDLIFQFCIDFNGNVSGKMVLKPHFDGNGYMFVVLYKDKNRHVDYFQTKKPVNRPDKSAQALITEWTV
jgi:hypothetical protein